MQSTFKFNNGFVFIDQNVLVLYIRTVNITWTVQEYYYQKLNKMKCYHLPCSHIRYCYQISIDAHTKVDKIYNFGYMLNQLILVKPIMVMVTNGLYTLDIFAHNIAIKRHCDNL